METGQRALTRVREAWENDAKHSGILTGVIINSYELRHLLCAIHYAEMGNEFPDGLSLLLLLKLTLSLWHFRDRALSLLLKFNIPFPFSHFASRDCFGKMKTAHDNDVCTFSVVSLMLCGFLLIFAKFLPLIDSSFLQFLSLVERLPCSLHKCH